MQHKICNDNMQAYAYLLKCKYMRNICSYTMCHMMIYAIPKICKNMQ